MDVGIRLHKFNNLQELTVNLPRERREVVGGWTPVWLAAEVTETSSA